MAAVGRLPPRPVDLQNARDVERWYKDIQLYLQQVANDAVEAAANALDVGALLDSLTASLGDLAYVDTIDTSQIANEAITVAKFAQGIVPVEIVDTLPVTGNFEGRVVMLTTTGKVYRYHSGAFIATVPTVDLTGVIETAQLADAAVTTAKLNDAAVSIAKFASGLTPVEIVSTLPSTGNFTGRTVMLTTDKKLYRYNGTSFTTAVAAVDITGTLATAQIADAAVTAAKIADAILTTAKFASGITPVEIVSTLPSTSNFTGRTVFLTTDKKLYRYDGSAFIASTATADLSGTIATAQIAAGAVTTAKIAADAVTAAEIAASAVGSSELAAGAVIAGKITAGTIVAADIAAGTITGAKIAATTVAASNIVANTITASQIAAGTITATEIATDTITAGQIAAGAVSTSELAATAVTTAKIAAGAVTANEIAANTITAAKIVAGTITATEIAAATITGAKIAATTITASNIAADTITAGQIAAAAITASELAAQAVTASKMAITDGFNLVSDPLFADATYWGFGTGVTASTDANITGNLSAASGIAIAGAGRASGAVIDTFVAANYNAVVETGKSYRANVLTRVAVGFTGQLALLISWYDQTKTLISSSTIATGVDYRTVAAAAAANASLEGVAAAPATAAYARARLRATFSTTLTNAGTAYMANPRLNRAASGELIVDGTITAAKIAANTITASKIAAGTITTAEIASATITAGNIAANTITASQIATDTITAGQIAAGAIGASEIAASAIIASKLAVTDFANLITDPLIEDAANSWTNAGSGGGVTMPSTDANILSQLYAKQGMTFAGAGRASGAVTLAQTVASMPVEGGKNYRIAYDWGVSAGFTGKIEVIIYWLDQAGSLVSSNTFTFLQDSRTVAVASAAYFPNNLYTFQQAAPNSARYAVWRWQVTWSTTLTNAGTAYFANPRFQRAQGGELIVDGAITAAKISVANLAAINADLGAITAGSLNIGSGKFTVDTSGNVVIKNAATGARLELTNSLMSVYDSGGTLRVRVGIW